MEAYSNTTLVKVKFGRFYRFRPIKKHSNTTLVKVKFMFISLNAGGTSLFKYNSC